MRVRLKGLLSVYPWIDAEENVGNLFMVFLMHLFFQDYLILTNILFALPDYEVDKYDIGSGFGHFGIAVDNVRLISFLLWPMLEHFHNIPSMHRLQKQWIS